MTHKTGGCIPALVAAGINETDANALRRISMTLHRWHELECGDGNDNGSWCITRGYFDTRGQAGFGHAGAAFNLTARCQVAPIAVTIVPALSSNTMTTAHHSSNTTIIFTVAAGIM